MTDHLMRPGPGERHVLLAEGLPVLVFPEDAPRTFEELTQEESEELDYICLTLLDVLNAPNEAGS